MKKLLSEGETGLVQKSNFLKILFSILIIFFYSNSAFPQVDLNGFGYYLEIPNSHSLLEISSFDVDKDGNIDIIGLDTSRTKIFVYYGLGANQFQPPRIYRFQEKIYKYYLNNLIGTSNSYLFCLDKNNGRLNIFEFNKRNIRKFKTIDVGLYPDNCIIKNFDATPNNEVLIYGINYYGITLISFDSTGFSKKNIDTNTTYSLISPIKINNDDYMDFVGVDNKKRLFLFLNRLNFSFLKTLYKKYNYKINDLYVGDFNEDKNQDIFLTFDQENSLQIIKGNGLGGFTDLTDFNLNFSPFKSFFSDFTKKALIDHLYISQNKRMIFLNVLNENYKYSQDIPVYNSNEEILSANIFRSPGQVGLILSIKKKGISLILNTTITADNYAFAIANKPLMLKSLNDYRNTFNYLTFIEEFTKEFVIIKRNDLQLPSRMYRIKLSKSFYNYCFNEIKQNYIQILFFSNQDNLAEYMEYDITSGELKRKLILLSGNLKHINFYNPDNQNNKEIALLIEIWNNYYYQRIDPFSFQQLKYEELLSYSEINNFVLMNDNNSLLFWRYSANEYKYDLVQYIPGVKNKEFKEKIIFSIKNPDIKKAFIYKFLDMKNEKYFGILNKDNKSIIIQYTPNKKNIRNIEYTIDETITDNLIYQINPKAVIYSNEIYFYSEKDDMIKSFEITKLKNNLFEKRIKLENKPESFVIDLSGNNKFSVSYLTNDSPLIHQIKVR